jgi:hypothetical protein
MICTKKKFKVTDLRYFRNSKSPALAHLKLRKWLKLIQGNRLDIKSDKATTLAVIKGTHR